MNDHFTKLEAWLRGLQDRGCELDMAPDGNPRATVYGMNDDDPFIERTAWTLREAFEKAVDALEENQCPN